MTALDVAVRYPARELASLLGQPEPTPQQVTVIEAPLEPALVVAGAGSGKTETMAARVVYLIANRLVRPDQVLGLTFTRKAAGELSRRVRRRLAQLVAIGEFASLRGDVLAGEAAISTYHSYAARVVSEHGVRSGFEPNTRLLTEAASWQLADSVVRTYDGDMSGVEFAVATVTKAVLDLAAGLAEHLRTPAELVGFTEWFAAELGSRPGRMFAPVERVLKRQAVRAKLLPLIEAYAERKQQMGAVDFADQMARAATVAADHPVVGEVERDRYRVVLLDEYQDTSHAQVVLLRSLFGGGHPVTAVGDPCQSIYGWRGASAGTLERFPTDFPRVDEQGSEPARSLPLSVSWRNRPEILTVANGLAAPLRTGETLRAADASAVEHAVVRGALLGTVLQEADWLADRIAEAWGDGSAVGRPTAAVLVRTRRQIPLLEAALRARGLPVEVVGLGGLLDTPEVRETVCTLRVLADPTDGASLLRLLAGPRWRVGPRDIVALHRRARALAADRRRMAEIEEQPQTHRLDDSALTEALLDLGPAERYSAEGHRRLRLLAAELRGLWARADQTLPDLIADVERTVGLDVEVAARGGEARLARAHLDRFADVAAEFAADAQTPTLSSFLAFCEAAERSERGLEPGKVEVAEDAVQLLTVHAAKGLEWDVVAVAGLCGGVFPARQQGDHWLSQPGVLPFELRGDSGGLPALRLGAASDQRGVRDAVEEFESEWREHFAREERRLAYVAVTRPRRLLLCSGYWWDDVAVRRRGPSRLLTEIRDLCWSGAGVVDAWVDEPEPDTENPLLATTRTAQWPVDPLGARRTTVTEAADLVLAELATLESGDPTRPRAGREAVIGPGSDPGCDAVAGSGSDPGRDAVTGPGSDRGRDAVTGSGSDPGRDAVVSPGPDPGRDTVAGEESGRDAAAEPGAGQGAATEPASEEERDWARQVDLLLAERDAGTPDEFEVALPESVTVATLVKLRADPAGLARRLRRPLPERPNPYARRGTAFHAWLERRYGGEELFDLDELPGAGDPEAAPDEVFEALREAYQASEWADRTPVAVEVPFTTVVGGLVCRGRIDAVFADPGRTLDPLAGLASDPPAGLASDPPAGLASGLPAGPVPDGPASGGPDSGDAASGDAASGDAASGDAAPNPPDGLVHYDVIDWKTGRPPSGRDAEAAAVQLAVYRLAWARLADVPVERVRAGFHYVRHNLTVRPADLLDADGLAALVTRLPAE